MEITNGLCWMRHSSRLASLILAGTIKLRILPLKTDIGSSRVATATKHWHKDIAKIPRKSFTLNGMSISRAAISDGSAIPEMLEVQLIIAFQDKGPTWKGDVDHRLEWPITFQQCFLANKMVILLWLKKTKEILFEHFNHQCNFVSTTACVNNVEPNWF